MKQKYFIYKEKDVSIGKPSPHLGVGGEGERDEKAQSSGGTFTVEI